MKRWQRTLAMITPVILSVYAPPVLVMVGLLLGLFAPSASARGAGGALFWLLIAAAVIAFPVSFVVGGRWLNAEGLPMPAGGGDRDAVVAAAARRILSSALITAAFGAGIAVLGVIHAMATGGRDRLVYFLALALAHAAFAVNLFAKARRAVVALAGRL